MLLQGFGFKIQGSQAKTPNSYDPQGLWLMVHTLRYLQLCEVPEKGTQRIHVPI